MTGVRLSVCPDCSGFGFYSEVDAAQALSRRRCRLGSLQVGGARQAAPLLLTLAELLCSCGVQGGTVSSCLRERRLRPPRVPLRAVLGERGEATGSRDTGL